MTKFTIVLSSDDLAIIGAALDELPRKISNPILVRIQEQINDQLPKPKKEGKVKPDEK